MESVESGAPRMPWQAAPHLPRGSGLRGGGNVQSRSSGGRGRGIDPRPLTAKLLEGAPNREYPRRAGRQGSHVVREDGVGRRVAGDRSRAGGRRDMGGERGPVV